jgi:hypothetical protein
LYHHLLCILQCQFAAARECKRSTWSDLLPCLSVLGASLPVPFVVYCFVPNKNKSRRGWWTFDNIVIFEVWINCQWRPGDWQLSNSPLLPTFYASQTAETTHPW